MNTLTKKQQLVLDYIKQSILKNGYPPTVREIATEIGVKSASTVQRHIEVLIEKEYMRRDPTKPRTIEIIDDCFNLTRREVVNVPVLGTVAAGQPLYAEKNIENYYPIPSDFLPNEETFMLKVIGNSMVNAGILEGDQIIVKMTSEVKNNDIVVALIDDIVTIKRFFKEDGHYRLQPENDSMEPIIVDRLKVLGKVIGLFRKGIHNI
ncbi:transcriptional repressor LexA [Clostridium sp. HBUAS56010]|uniref:transcriptional repressor LexA n=1 Tax=Clostridium sp. HBUAS56010 TaxID=2571127 RepID=UPI0011781085|nr:transcriptional repressor LexA [Clostridium sp. HBUAS56010]